MKKIILLFIVLSASMLFFSCTKDIVGDMPENSIPKLMVYDTSDIISNKQTRVQWYGNDVDGTGMSYFYCLTTDTTLTVADARTNLADSLWNETTNSYVDISMPFAPYPYTTTPIFIDNTTYVDTIEAISVEREIVYSKFFIYGVDEKGGYTSVVSKVFGRTNKVPKHPMVNSQKLGVNGFDEYYFTIGPDSATMVLKQETSFWKPIDFRWMGEDPDGPEVDLEFRWELWALDSLRNDIEIIQQSNGWSMSFLSAEFSRVIHDYNDEGNYSFRLWVRDDALEESENHATVNFAVFAPKLDRGILYIDDTDDAKYDLTKYILRGNPDGTEVNALYDELLQDAGYQADATDPLMDYDVVHFTTPLPGQLYQPSLQVLSKYRLVIIATEDRTNSTGIDYASYKSQLINYMNIGGKVMIIGNSAILLSDLVINDYQEPVRDIFNNTNPYMNYDMLTFFYNYFGIYSYSTGESKTFFSQFLYDAGHPLLPKDYYLTENYDFIGATKYDHISDSRIETLKVDSAQVNKYWKDFNGPGGSVFEFSLKENGTVLTGVPAFEAYKGEIVLKYQSIFDLERTDYNNDLSFELNGTDSLFHDLNWHNPNPTADPTETDSDGNSTFSDKVLQKSGAVATRYISEGDVFRTAYVGIPLIFMDNTDGKVSGFFSAMIDWFDLEINPVE